MFDIIIILIIAGFIWKGVRLGLIEALGGVVGVFIGLLCAGRWWQVAASSIEPMVNSQILATAIGWLLVFIVVNRLVALVFWVVDKIFHIIAIIPFLKSINSLLGGFFGLIEGFFVVGSIISVMLLLPMTDSLKENVAKSKFSRVFAFVDVLAQKVTPQSVKNWTSGDYIKAELNQLKSDSLDSVNPFKGFGGETSVGLKYLQQQLNELQKDNSTSTPGSSTTGSYDQLIPEDAFEPTPVE